MPRRLPAFLLATILLGACGPQFRLPDPGQTALVAAQREIATAPPLQEHARGPAEQREMLRRVATRIAAAAQDICRAQRGGDCAFRIGYDPSGAVNAYASGSGDVVVTAGLLRIVDNDAELAAVVAHEFAHHIANHIGRARTRTTIGALAGAVVGAYSGLGDLSGLGAQAGRLVYSKSDEREADYLAAYITAWAGYDLDRAGGNWAKLAGSGDRRVTAGLLDTHPAGPERLAAWELAKQEIAASPERRPQPRAVR
ncbi:M48 family metalloprotease [Roseicella aerolata]|uniref:M48 family metalloprotease n=1 Tax=Roseicella aerolata TaxID=2883479 RepID=A0A9X1ICG5_9PROT|nr:M48 family metalloprotease [Roseicella aerolata]MCB4821163.1 M48 family metalloprotease [Roseicella aerolata]